MKVRRTTLGNGTYFSRIVGAFNAAINTTEYVFLVSVRGHPLFYHVHVLNDQDFARELSSIGLFDWDLMHYPYDITIENIDEETADIHVRWSGEPSRKDKTLFRFRGLGRKSFEDYVDKCDADHLYAYPLNTKGYEGIQ